MVIFFPFLKYGREVTLEEMGKGQIFRAMRVSGCMAALLAGSLAPVGAGELLSHAASYQVFGETEFRFFEAGAVRREVTNKFRVSVHGCSSEIETTDITLAGKVQAASYTHKSDGTNSCFIILLDQGSLADVRQPAARIPTSALADLRPDVFPPCHIGFIAPVWLGYASHCALGRAGSGRVPPLVFMGAAWPDYGGEISASWLRSTNSPNLPERLIEYADQQIFAFVDALAREDAGTAVPVAYQAGYTNAIYQVLVWTNIGSFKLPFHSRLTRYIPAASGKDARDLEVQLTYDSFLSGVSMDKARPILLPSSLPSRTRISDYRFGKSGDKPHVYSSADGSILSLKQIKAMEDPTPHARPVFVVYLLFGLVLVLPVVLFLSRRIKGKSKT